MLENYNISNEEFTNKFTGWLLEQSPSNFRIVNGFEIIRAFIKQYLSDDLLTDRTEYKFFISDKRELIKVIENWIATLDLSFDDYKMFFEIYCKDYLKENYTHIKITFSSIDLSFQNKIIKPNYIIDKAILIKKDLEYIFNNSLNNCKKNLKIENENINIKRNTGLIETRNKYFELEKQFAKNEIEEKNARLARATVEEKEAIKKIKEYNREYKKKYKERFPEKIKAEKKQYKNKRVERDISFKLLQRMRARILLVLHGKRKLSSSLELLGCSSEFLKKHLESKFKEGMTWDNYGVKGWHIDHIIPCASFDFTNIEDQKKCFHYSNLQPLWWLENIMKSDKIL